MPEIRQLVRNRTWIYTVSLKLIVFNYIMAHELNLGQEYRIHNPKAHWALETKIMEHCSPGRLWYGV